jgi:hypothetical protein
MTVLAQLLIAAALVATAVSARHGRLAAYLPERQRPH